MGLLPCSVVEVFHADRLLAFRMAEKISKTLIVVLRKLLLSGHSLIQTKESCEVVIEELNNLREEIEDTIESVEYL